MSESLGRLLRSWRQDAGLTQAGVAEELGIGTPHWSKIEADRERPSLRLLMAICDLFDGELSDVLPVAGRCAHCGAFPDPVMQENR